MTALPVLRPEHEAVLSLLLHVLEDCGFAWALTGSASFALQGVVVEVQDIDVQTCEAGAYVIQERFTDPGLGPGDFGPVVTIRPVGQSEVGNVRSHFGVFSVAAVRIEVLGAIQKRGDGEDWESPVDVAALRSFVEWRGWRVPVLPLEYEVGAYVKLGRLERATLLRDAVLARWIHRGIPLIQCSSGSLALLGGGSYENVSAMLKGAQVLGWPFLELRLWRDSDRGSMEEAAHRVAKAGIGVASVHAPRDTEVLLSTPGREREAIRLLRECLGAAAACRAHTLVVHAWDARLPAFCMDSLVANLNRACDLCLSEGVTLSVETLPGYAAILHGLLRACPLATYTVDTYWATLEGAWVQLFTLVPKITNVHVQTYVDEAGAISHTLGIHDVAVDTGVLSGMAACASPIASGPVTGGRVKLGRTPSGHTFDAGAVIRGFRSRGYSGLITLEPNGVLAAGADRLRSALLLLGQWVSA